MTGLAEIRFTAAQWEHISKLSTKALASRVIEDAYREVSDMHAIYRLSCEIAVRSIPGSTANMDLKRAKCLTPVAIDC